MAGNKLTIGAVGVGAVGTILSSCLKEGGAEVVVADIPQRIAQVRENGLQMIWGEKRFENPVATVDSIRSLADVHPDCIFIATKACILKHILADVAQAAGEETIVLSVQNGIGTEDEIARHIPARNAWRMVVNYAGMIDQSGVTKVSWFNPPNFIGPLIDQDDERMTRLVEMLGSVGMTTELVDSVTVKKRAWLKTILNSALMPVCAVMHLTMKEATEGRATRRLAADLLDEGLAVAARLGYEYGDDIFEKCMSYLDKGGHHHPSMSIDLSNSRPTEIDFINGKIVEVGRQFGDVDLEVNRVFVSLVMTQEVRNGTRKPEDFPEYLVGS